jgi:hypothetical protein
MKSLFATKTIGFTSHPPGSPPPGFEDRMKYSQVSVPGA